MDNQYSNGKIYLITVGDRHYVGSTVLTMNVRMTKHRADRIDAPERRLYDAVSDVGGWHAVQVEVLEEYPCSSDVELRWRERHWYDELQPELNMRRPIISPSEQHELRRKANSKWMAGNRDAQAAYQREHYAANRQAKIDKAGEWARNNRERRNELARARYAAKKAVNSSD